LQCDNLCKRYQEGTVQTDVLHDVSFSIGEGEMMAIVGSSGSGMLCESVLRVGKHIKHLADSTTLPPDITATRSQIDLITFISWVISTIVIPSCALICLSRA
ncbi:hypothetical protein MJI37_30265, partial [Salmonella enterica subsp. enterica serovar Cerro]|nr:hypothetical protein [Salmonella enterica subsp. enterica serovar Cerro]